MEIITASGKETEEVGFLIGEKVTAPAFFALRGDLGGGKTTFMRGFARGLGIDDVSSPTFVIFKKYKINNGNFYHFDAYRIKEEDLSSLYFNEIVAEKNNIIAVEWSENIEKALPLNKIEISFSFISEKERKLIIKGINGKIKSVLRARGSAG